MMEIFSAGPVAFDLIATPSSPVARKLWAMVMLRDEMGSIPSVFRAVAGVSKTTAQAVKPSTPFKVTWKLGELSSLIL